MSTRFAVLEIVLRGRFRDGDTTIYMLCNRSRTDATLVYQGDEPAMLLDPRDGSEKPVERGVQVTVPAMRAIFVVV